MRRRGSLVGSNIEKRVKMEWEKLSASGRKKWLFKQGSI